MQKHEGWIKESNTLEYSDNLKRKVQNEVQVRPGEIEYETLIFEDIATTLPTKASDNEYGRIEESRQLYVKIVYPSGRTVWVRQESIDCPEAY